MGQPITPEVEAAHQRSGAGDAVGDRRSPRSSSARCSSWSSPACCTASSPPCSAAARPTSRRSPWSCTPASCRRSPASASCALNFVRGTMSSATNLGVFVQMLPEDSFVVRFLGMIDLMWVWYLIVLAIGLGVLYRRKTGPIAMGLFAVYFVSGVGYRGRSQRLGGFMTRRKKVLIGGGVLLVAAALVGANFYFKRAPGKTVNVEALKLRDLEATVSASGKIQAQTTGQHQLGYGRPRHAAVGPGRRSRQEGPVPDADRSAQPADGHRARRGRGGRSAGVARTAAHGHHQRPREPHARTREPAPPARAVGAAVDDARTARQLRERRQGARSGTARARTGDHDAGTAHPSGAGQPGRRALRPEQGPHRIAARRHRHPPQHRRG